VTPESNQPPFGRVGIIDEAMSEPLGFFEGLDLQVTYNALEAVEIALSEMRGLIRQGKGEEVAELIRRSRAWYEGEPWN